MTITPAPEAPASGVPPLTRPEMDSLESARSLPPRSARWG
ncbi:hypothetical protein SVIOM74S_03156 [Streptomyces violarus]